MRTKSIILASILLFGGGSLLSWVLTEQREEQAETVRCQLKYGTENDDYLEQYNEWLQLPPEERAGLPLFLDEDGKAKTREQIGQEQQERLKADIDKIVSGEITVHPFSDVLYGENWHSKLNEYKRRKSLNENILKGSVVCTSVGALVYTWWLLVWVGQAIGAGVARLRQWRSGDSERSKKAAPVKATAQKAASKKAKPDRWNPTPGGDAPREQGTHRPSDPSEPRPNFVNVNWQRPVQKAPAVKRDPRVSAEVNQIKRISDEAEKIAMLLSDEESIDLKASPGTAPEQSESRDSSKPLSNTLRELSQQVSAIREYTTYQQNRLEKLQDGYDWNIVRTFCLRVIRCIDNLEHRISQMGEDEARATHLEEVRDELVFALESSGIEQFRPEINSQYRGQEKCAEAVKDKQPCDEPEQAGKIADVIRPGYQYFINEENIKVVRPAQVKLFA
ncbi:MAG: nucleotide exchange factor GrpE [Planctomycetota bacterium]|jgi:molecular chaperone GrpE (heat shock protein)